MNVTNDSGRMLEKHLPLLLGLLLFLFAGKALKKIVWTALGMYRALGASGTPIFG